MTNDTLRQLEERVARIEEELQQIRGLIAKAKEPEIPWWEQIRGSFKDDPVFAEIVRLGRQIRRADRPKAKKKSAKGRKRAAHKANPKR
jgi:hypothetical protein